MNTADVATPEALVVAVFTPPANVPEAPLPGAANVTRTPLTAVPLAPVTVADSGLAKAVSMFAPCGVPPVALMAAGVAEDWLKFAVYVVGALGATKVRGLAVDPSPQLVNTYPLGADAVTWHAAPGFQLIATVG